jgi:hypothetical protein
MHEIQRTHILRLGFLSRVCVKVNVQDVIASTSGPKHACAQIHEMAEARMQHDRQEEHA